MNRQILLDLHKKNLTSSDYNIIHSITKDKILLHPGPDVGMSDMVITDTDDAIRFWKEKGMAVIAWSHEKNPEESLMQAPWLIFSLEALTDSFPEEVWHRHHGLPLRLLETERCYLRELAMDDLDSLLALDAEQEPDSPGRFFVDSAMEAGPDFISQARDYLSRYIACQYPFYGYGIYGAYDRSDDCFLGIVGFCQTDRQETGFQDIGSELGYAVRSDRRRQGYAREWILSLTDYARQNWDMEEFFVRIPRGHTASIRTALSCHLRILEI